MKTKQQIKNIKETIQNNKEGFSCDLNGNLSEKKSGYFVAFTDIKGKNLNHLIKKVLMIQRRGFKQMGKNIFIGGWNDGLNFYLDLSLWIGDKETAIKTGLLFNQKAIFDLNKFDVLQLK